MDDTNMSKLAYSKGFSLISLMVAMLIGIFIMAAAGKVYLKTKSSFNARTALSTMTENGHFALQDLRRTLIMAGMGITASEASSLTFRSIPSLVSGGTEVGSGQNSDVVAVRYRRGNSCGGYIDNPSPLAPATLRFLIVNEQLMCQKDGATPQPLVSGIKVMKVLYGVDDTADGYANRYLNATQVNALGKWINIVSIRIGLVVDSAEYKLPVEMRETAAYDLSLLGMTYTVPANDEKAYKVFTTTVQLRNLNAIMQQQ
jgi:type IV pilus assembly protein PilW